MTADEKRIAAKVEERRRWAELQRTYERCLVIADDVWGARLDAAQMAQDSLAQNMRDREPIWAKPTQAHEGNWMMLDRGIPVPLFTPRDRQQFIKEVATTLLIEANRRGLTVTPELKDAPKEQMPGEAPAIEAASGADETPVEVAPA